MTQLSLRMKKGSLLSLVVGVLALILATGCEKSMRDGFEDGVSSVVSAIIQAPVDYAIDKAFSEQ